MSILSLDNIRHETRLVIRVSKRDVFKRMSALLLIVGVCWIAGARSWLWAVVGSILVCEAVLQAVIRREPPEDQEMPLGLAMTMWVTNVVSTLFYLGPAAVLAAQPELPFVLAAFLWIFGLFVHVSNSFVALPAYNWSQMAVAFAAGLGVIAVAAATHDAGGAPALWIVVTGLFFVYVVNTIETMSSRKEFQHELDEARTTAKARLAALEHLTRHDPLTGLLNRQAFDEELGRLLSRRRAGRVVAVLLFDLDGFKPINDTYSHAAGDAVLVAIARRLAAFSGPEGLAARLGGDEFALALPDLSSGEEALRLARDVAIEIERPVGHEGKELTVSASVGIALDAALPAPGQEDAAVALLCSAADQAMYRAKATARAGPDHQAVLYDANDFPPRPSLEDRRRLSEALASRQIKPAYQPVVELQTGRIAGFEALARWHHPTEGLLAPRAFIPLITELGLQGDFLCAMAEQVFDDIEALRREGLDPGRVSLNVPEIALATHSGRRDVDRILSAHPEARRHVVFEITEDVFIARAAEMIQGSIAHFRARGVGISLDDFGTGFASFQHLRQIEFDELKVDMSFVADLGRDPAAEILVGAFVAMGEGLGARIIAEGVETEAQRLHLLRLGCRHGQGFLFGRAMPFAEARLRLAIDQDTVEPRAVAQG